MDSFFNIAKELDIRFNKQDDILIAQKQLINNEY